MEIVAPVRESDPEIVSAPALVALVRLLARQAALELAGASAGAKPVEHAALSTDAQT
jgi:hypothetical protein